MGDTSQAQNCEMRYGLRLPLFDVHGDALEQELFVELSKICDVDTVSIESGSDGVEDCSECIPGSVRVDWSWPWQNDQCKCNEQYILWGYGIACDPRLSLSPGWFNAHDIFNRNGQDRNACGCVF